MNRIAVDADTCGGKPRIKGTRITVRNVLGLLAGGYSVERVLETHPVLSRDDVEAAIAYGRDDEPV